MALTSVDPYNIAVAVNSVMDNYYYWQIINVLLVFSFLFGIVVVGLIILWIIGIIKGW